MKKLLSLLFIVSCSMSAQTVVDLSGLTQNIVLGQNCSSSQPPQHFVTTGDSNLNGFAITLRNAVLIVNGNINGPGEITSCGNSSSQVCRTGVTQNNPVFIDITLVDCNTLSTTEFDFTKDFGYNYTLYDVSGRILKEGKTDENLHSLFPTNQVLLLQVEGFKSIKIIKN